MNTPPHPLWDQTIEVLQGSIEPYDFRHWIRPIRCDEVDEDAHQVVLSVPDALHERWLQENFVSEIRNVLRTITREDFSVTVNSPDHEDVVPDSAVKVNTSSRQSSWNPKLDLIDRYRFDAFIDGPTNRFALTAARAVADHPGTRYNPLFLYGGVGLGKTHLLHAIGHEVLKQRPDAKVAYVTSEAFVNELIDAIRSHKMQQFRMKYRDNCDVLLVDDIQFIAGKDRTQEEFFHLFNTLHSSHKQIVMTSDTVPQSIPDMEDRLKSRLQWGLIANINPPSFETRVAILKRKAEADRTQLPDDVAMLIARHVRNNVRELEGVLMRLQACSGIFNRSIDLSMAEEVLSDLVQESMHHVSIEQIMNMVAQEFGVAIGDLKGPRRQREITIPRQVAMSLIRDLTHESLPQIGQCFGGRDHTTVINAVKRVEDLKSAVPGLSERIARLRARLTSHS
jgi:chromosomal replication initiator protein